MSRMEPLKVSDDGTHLSKADSGAPFFWLADTAWLLHRLTAEELTVYFRDRSRRRFTVVQGPNLAGWGRTPNSGGEFPFKDGDTDAPNASYWSYTDEMVQEAAQCGLYLALVVMWGDDYGRLIGTDAGRAKRLGRWLGERYGRCDHVIWIVSGEYGFYRPPDGEDLKVFHGLAGGIREVVGRRQIMTIHPFGIDTVPLGSGEEFHDAEWLDFNMLQSGHERDNTNYESITALGEKAPRKPALDGEPLYEGHAVDLWADPMQPCEYYETATAHDVRKAAYRSVFAGACGHTYGHIGVWSMFRPGDVCQCRCHHPETDWRGCLDAPGAVGMTYLHDLVASRPGFEKRVADQALMRSPAGNSHFHRRACRADDGGWAMVYLPKGGRVEVDLEPLRGPSVAVRWYDPRNGEWNEAGTVPAQGRRTFYAPSCGGQNDWVLVLERRDEREAG